MNTVKKVAAATKNFVVAHKTGIALVAGTAIGLAVNRAAIKSHNEFLKEHDLYDTFYSIPE